MTKKDAEFQKGCMSFKAYGGIDEYIDDIRKCLVLSDWHYSEDRAKEIIQENDSFIKQDYENKVPAWSSAVEVGYGCG